MLAQAVKESSAMLRYTQLNVQINQDPDSSEKNVFVKNTYKFNNPLYNFCHFIIKVLALCTKTAQKMDDAL